MKFACSSYCTCTFQEIDSWICHLVWKGKSKSWNNVHIVESWKYENNKTLALYTKDISLTEENEEERKKSSLSQKQENEIAKQV